MTDVELYRDLFRRTNHWAASGCDLGSWNPSLLGLLLDVAEAEDVPVTFGPPPKGAPPQAGGCYSSPGGTAIATGLPSRNGAIWVNDTLPRNEQTKNLAHELCHHFTPNFNGVALQIGRGGIEVIGESAAYILGRHLGHDTSQYSASYVQGWATDLPPGLTPDVLQAITLATVRRLESAINQNSGINQRRAA